MRSAYERIFLLDGAGALLSALCLGVLLPSMHRLVGLPVSILHGLSLLALAYALYDLCCLKWADKTRPLWLTLVIAANSSHLVLTLYLLSLYRQRLELLGALYFTTELLILAGLIFYELTLVAQLRSAVNERSSP